MTHSGNNASSQSWTRHLITGLTRSPLTVCTLYYMRLFCVNGLLPVRWIPEQQDPLFLTQSATLQAHYYYVQIAVHRPFMAASYRDSPLSFPSVIICTNAARSSIQVLDVLYQRNGHPHHRNMVCRSVVVVTGHTLNSVCCACVGVVVYVRHHLDDEHLGTETRGSLGKRAKRHCSSPSSYGNAGLSEGRVSSKLTD